MMTVMMMIMLMMKIRLMTKMVPMMMMMMMMMMMIVSKSKESKGTQVQPDKLVQRAFVSTSGWRQLPAVQSDAIQCNVT